jgi:rRNA-processing protein FCF1
LSSKIALADTNILMYSVMQKIELIDEVKSMGFNLVTSKCVMEELAKLSGKNLSAKIAMNVYSGIGVVGGEGMGDDCILDACTKNNLILISNDRILCDRAMKKGIAVLNLEDGRKLTWRR